MDVYTLWDHAKFITRLYPENTIRKNCFLAACKTLDETVDLNEINRNCPYGGIIGINNSKLDTIFRHSKIFRLHAIMHDSAGYMCDKYRVGPGYCYVIKKCPINSCFLGHISGLLFCVYLKWFDNTFDTLEC